MKKLLMALVLTAFAVSGAEAQVKCTAPVKHKKKVVRTTRRVTQSVARTESCRSVPYQVCSINPDRRSVSCYKTMDLYGLTPLNGEVTHFGPQDRMPGPTEDLTRVPTTVIRGEKQGDHCRRDEANKATVCEYNGKTLQRDANGFYSYRRLPGEGTITNVLPDNALIPMPGVTLR